MKATDQCVMKHCACSLTHRSMEAQQRRLADAAIRDAEEAGHAVQRCKELEDELEAAKAREAELNRKILKVLDDNREFEDRCLKVIV